MLVIHYGKYRSKIVGGIVKINEVPIGVFTGPADSDVEVRSSRHERLELTIPIGPQPDAFRRLQRAFDPPWRRRPRHQRPLRFGRRRRR